jgi:hypothetical protein
MSTRPHVVPSPNEVLLGELVDDDVIDSHALDGLLGRARPWSAQPADLGSGVTVLLWMMLLLDLGVSGWLFGVTQERLGCTGVLCSMATLNGHPQVTMALAAGSSLLLLGTCVLSRFFTRGRASVLLLAGVGAVIASVVVIGAVLVVVLISLLAVVAVITGLLILSRLLSS